jgi:propanediol dehydratase large subunit
LDSTTGGVSTFGVSVTDDTAIELDTTTLDELDDCRFLTITELRLDEADEVLTLDWISAGRDLARMNIPEAAMTTAVIAMRIYLFDIKFVSVLKFRLISFLIALTGIIGRFFYA